MHAHVVYRKIGVVPLHRIATPRGHDIKTLQHDGRDHVQTTKVQPRFIVELFVKTLRKYCKRVAQGSWKRCGRIAEGTRKGCERVVNFFVEGS